MPGKEKRANYFCLSLQICIRTEGVLEVGQFRKPMYSTQMGNGVLPKDED